MRQKVFSSLLSFLYPRYASSMLWSRSWWAWHCPPWTADGFNQCQSQRSRVESGHLEKGRYKNYTTFHHAGKIVCGKTFRFLHTVGKKRMYNLAKSLKENWLTPRIHGNLHKRPKHCLTSQLSMWSNSSWATESRMCCYSLDGYRDTVDLTLSCFLLASPREAHGVCTTVLLKRKLMFILSPIQHFVALEDTVAIRYYEANDRPSMDMPSK